MKPALLIPFTLSFFALAACSHGGSGSNGLDLNKIAKNIQQNDKECPTNLSGTFCKGDGSQSNGQTCITPDLRQGQNSLEYSEDEQSYLAVDGKVHDLTREGQTVQFLLYCDNMELH